MARRRPRPATRAALRSGAACVRAHGMREPELSEAVRLDLPSNDAVEPVEGCGAQEQLRANYAAAPTDHKYVDAACVRGVDFRSPTALSTALGAFSRPLQNKERGSTPLSESHTYIDLSLQAAVEVGAPAALGQCTSVAQRVFGIVDINAMASRACCTTVHLDALRAGVQTSTACVCFVICLVAA